MRMRSSLRGRPRARRSGIVVCAASSSAKLGELPPAPHRLELAGAGDDEVVGRFPRLVGDLLGGVAAADADRGLDQARLAARGGRASPGARPGRARPARRRAPSRRRPAPRRVAERARAPAARPAPSSQTSSRGVGCRRMCHSSSTTQGLPGGGVDVRRHVDVEQDALFAERQRRDDLAHAGERRQPDADARAGRPRTSSPRSRPRPSAGRRPARLRPRRASPARDGSGPGPGRPRRAEPRAGSAA